jgi:hypothetical protein
MAIMLSQSQSIPPGLQIVKNYGSISASGQDVNEAVLALIDRANTLQKYQGVNWIIALSFSEIPGTQCAATGFAFDLQPTP